MTPSHFVLKELADVRAQLTETYGLRDAEAKRADRAEKDRDALDHRIAKTRVDLEQIERRCDGLQDAIEQWSIRAYAEAGQPRAGYLPIDEIIAQHEERGAEIADLRAELADYARLRAAVDEFDGGCAPGCDSYGHADDCRQGMAHTLALQQAEVVRLRAEIEELRRRLAQPLIPEAGA